MKALEKREMQRKRFWWVCSLAAALGVSLVSETWAQGPGGRRGGGRGGRGMMSRMILLNSEQVLQELGLSEEAIASLRESLREQRGQRGPGGPRGEGRRGPGGERGRPGEGGPPEGRGQGDREPPSAEERAAMAKERADRERTQLQNLLTEPQLKRLDELFVQLSGARALVDPQVADSLGLADDEVEMIGKAVRDANANMREEMREIFQDGGFEGAREKMAQLREEADQDIMALLSDDQLSAFEMLSGEKSEITAESLMQEMFRRGRGRQGRGGPGGGPGGRRGEGRPARPERPPVE